MSLNIEVVSRWIIRCNMGDCFKKISFVDEHEGGCKKSAIEAGWFVGEDGEATCPRCAEYKKANTPLKPKPDKTVLCFGGEEIEMTTVDDDAAPASEPDDSEA